MSTAGVKIQFQKKDLEKAANKILGLKNTIIENSSDAESLFNSIIGVTGDGTYWGGNERPCRDRVEIDSCNITEDVIIVKFSAKNEMYTNEYLNCVKEIQNLLADRT